MRKWRTKSGRLQSEITDIRQMKEWISVVPEDKGLFQGWSSGWLFLGGAPPTTCELVLSKIGKDVLIGEDLERESIIFWLLMSPLKIYK